MMQQSTWTVPVLEKRLFLGAVVIGLVHAVDDAVLNREPGVPAGQHLVASEYERRVVECLDPAPPKGRNRL